MMGTKMPHLSPLSSLSFEELVPKENFYRRLDAMLDLSFVRELVRDCYASSGRPSGDPVVFFRLQLVMSGRKLLSKLLVGYRLLFHSTLPQMHLGSPVDLPRTVGQA